MKKRIQVLALLATLGATHSSTAQEASTNRFFVAVEAGIAEHTIDASGGYEDESGNSFSPSIALGYMFTPNISMVAQYTQYGEADLFSADIDFEDVVVGTTFSSETTGISLVGQYMTDPSPSGWSYGAKLGLINWDTDLNISATSAGASASDTLGDDKGVAVYGGFIITYALGEKVDVTLNADWFVNDLDVELIEGSQMDMQYSRYTVGLKYQF